MTVQLIIDNVNIPVKHIRFSDGSSSVKLEVPDGFKPSAYYSISVDPTTPADNYLWEILLVQDAVHQTFGPFTFEVRYLMLPYLPHARADRVFEKGNPLPLQIFIDSMLGFTNISLVDPHSDFFCSYQDLIEYTIKYQHQCFIEVVGNDIKSGDILISPDKGASLKIGKLQLNLDHRTISTWVVEAGKKRDTLTGKVVETTLPEGTDLSDKTCWIVDDIADGGGTFIPLALKLKEAGAAKVNLYVTHGIFAKGLLPFKGIIDKIYAYQTINTYVNRIDIDTFNRGIIYGTETT